MYIKNEAIYIGTFCHDTMHAQFNASLLIMCSLTFDHVIYLSETLNKQEVFELIKKYNLKNIKWKNLFVVQGNSKIKLLFRYIISALQNIRILLITSKNKILIYNYNNLFSVHIINFLNKILKKRIIIFCHGEMELIIDNKTKQGGFLHKLLALQAKLFFLKNSNIQENIFFTVLGSSIKENLFYFLSAEKMNHFITIDHPYIFDNMLLKDDISINTLKIGTVGTFSQIKGGDLFVSLAQDLGVKNRRNLQFFIVGKIFYDIEVLKETGIILPVNNGFDTLSMDDYTNSIQELTIILCPYPIDTYKLTASAAILDAINVKKPLLAFRNDYFNYMFKKYGEFGYLVENIDEMILLINKLAAGDIKIKKYQFEQLQGLLSPETVQKSFKKELEKVKILL